MPTKASKHRVEPSEVDEMTMGRDTFVRGDESPPHLERIPKARNAFLKGLTP